MTKDIWEEFTEDELNEIERALRQRVLKIEHPLAFDLIKVLAKVKHAKRIYVLDMVRRNREQAGIDLPREFDASLQQALEYYCRESDVFKTRKVSDDEALFCWPKGKGKGVWALIRQNAAHWVREKQAQIRRQLLGGC